MCLRVYSGHRVHQVRRVALTVRGGAIVNGLHVGVIMDGNGRWAQAHGLPRLEGHLLGVEALRRTVEAAPAARHHDAVGLCVLDRQLETPTVRGQRAVRALSLVSRERAGRAD